MNYRAKIENEIRSYRESISRIKEQINELQNDLSKNEGAFNSALEKSLEEMCQALSERNDYEGKLTSKEKEVIDFVESGRYKTVLENMPESARKSFKRKTDEDYKKAKKKFPSEKELAVCGFLYVEEKDKNYSNIGLTIPVKFKDIEKTGSLEEALYEHNVNVVNFSQEQNCGGYVGFTLNTSKEEVEERLSEIASNLEKDLSQPLRQAGVNYSVIALGTFEGRYETTSPELIEREEKEKPNPRKSPRRIKEKEFYKPSEAIKFWQKELKNRGYNFDENTIRIYLRGAEKYKKPLFVIKNVKKKVNSRTYFEKESFDRFARNFGIDMKKGSDRVVPYAAVELNQYEGDKLRNKDFAKILGVHESTIRQLVRSRIVKSEGRGYVSLSSALKFANNHVRGNGDKRTTYIPIKNYRYYYGGE